MSHRKVQTNCSCWLLRDALRMNGAREREPLQERGVIVDGNIAFDEGNTDNQSAVGRGDACIQQSRIEVGHAAEDR